MIPLTLGRDRRRSPAAPCTDAPDPQACVTGAGRPATRAQVSARRDIRRHRRRPRRRTRLRRRRPSRPARPACSASRPVGDTVVIVQRRDRRAGPLARHVLARDQAP